MQDLINNIESRCEILDTTVEDPCYEGQHLSAEYDADEDATYISGETYQCKDAFRALTHCHWSSSAKAWVCDGNQVAAVRAADHRWEGGRTTLARRIASALRSPEYLRHPAEIAEEKAGKCGDHMDARLYVAVMIDRCKYDEQPATEAATCAALEPAAAVEDAEPAKIAISLRPVVAAAANGAAHAVRSARARKAWETRRKNAARQAEILNATCEPLVTTSDALPASVLYSATPSAECCHGRTAHGTEGRVVDPVVCVTHALWDAAGGRWVNAPSTEGQWCDRGTVVTNGKDDVQVLVDHTLRRVDTSRCPRVMPCEPTETYPVRLDAPCLTPAEGRRERRNARRRELYRLRRAA